MNSDNDITELIHQAREGSDEAVGVLIDTVRTYLLLIANQETDVRLQGKVAASDIVQEACLLAHQHFSTFRGNTEGELRRWMRQVLLNSLSDSRKKFLQSQKRAVSREAGPANQQTVECGELTPASAALAQEEADLLQAAMDRLSSDYRTVLRLRNWTYFRSQKSESKLVVPTMQLKSCGVGPCER